jgi:hypothetical protein
MYRDGLYFGLWHYEADVDKKIVALALLWQIKSL